MLKGNLLVGQSGGPTAVINATLAGIISSAQASLDGKIYGMCGGLEGLLSRADFIELSSLNEAQLERLKQTSGGALGAGRIKPFEQDLERALDHLKQHDIHYFIFIGGNGSMQTPLELERIAKKQGYELYCAGAPKTVDNDLYATDHTPGYGSAARWLAQHTLDSGLDLYTMRGFDHFKVVEAMGRHTGWLAAATVLARFRPTDPPHLILLPEIIFDEAAFLSKVEAIFKREGCVLVVASEGVRDKAGKFLAEANTALNRDPVGKPMLSLGEGISGYLCQLVKEKLGIKARYDKPGTLQRGAACVSPTDREEAYQLGQAAAQYVLAGQSGRMSGLVRLSNAPYQCKIVPVKLSEVVGRERTIPPEFLTSDGLNEAAFREYVAPLIGPALLEPMRLGSDEG